MKAGALIKLRGTASEQTPDCGALLTAEGCVFRVWAPHAKSAAVAGSFSDWEPIAMKKQAGGFWSVTVSGAAENQPYQYLFTTQEGDTVWKPDPCAPQLLSEDSYNSLTPDAPYHWEDESWLRWRRGEGSDFAHLPMNLYQVELTSWRRTGTGELLSLPDLAQLLVPYAKSMGYTHIALMPVWETDEGGAPLGFFSVSRRLGTPTALKQLIDRCHQAGLGVLLDWTPEYFSRHERGLRGFDGRRCYGTGVPWDHTICSFDLSDRQVQRFLLQSARWWLEEYHLDGLHIPAPPRPHSAEGLRFLRRVNTLVREEYPGVITVGDNIPDRPGLTGRPDSTEDLGFSLIMDEPWADTAVRYLKTDPIYRRGLHRELCGRTMSSFFENGILPLSHKLFTETSLAELQPMPELSQRLAGVRAFWLYTLAHPGKKLTMMGTEFSQLAPWNPNQSLDWHLLQNPYFRRQQDFFREASRLYLASPALWQGDDSPSSFTWLEERLDTANFLAWLRRVPGSKPILLAVNFSGLERRSVVLGVPEPGRYRVLLSSDDPQYGGSGRGSAGLLPSNPVPGSGYRHSVFLDLPPFTALLLTPAEADKG